MARVPGTTLKPRIRLAAPRNANLLRAWPWPTSPEKKFYEDGSICEDQASNWPGVGLRRITSKTESESLHQAELARTLKEFLEPIRRG